MSANKFVTWLTGEIDRRGWNNSELARRAGLVPSAISQVISGTRKPGFEFCIKVARPLDMTPEEVLRRAGLLPKLSAPEDNPTYQELRDKIRRLPIERQKDLLKIAITFLQEENE